MSDDAGTTTIRIALDPKQIEAFDEIMRLCGLETRSEVINAAMTLFEHAVRSAHAGKRVAIVDADGEERLTMPALERARANGTKASAKPKVVHTSPLRVVPTPGKTSPSLHLVEGGIRET